MITKGTITGTAVIEQYVTGDLDANNNPIGRWYDISPLISDATASVFGANLVSVNGVDVDGTNLPNNNSGDPSYSMLWKHTEGNTQYERITSDAEALAVGKGYVIRHWISLAYSYIGTPNTGNQGANNNCSRSTGQSFEGWNLIGNPYPSAIDWAAGTGITRTNIYNTVVFRTGEAASRAFVTYNGAGSVGTTFGSEAANGIIPSGQAFWVKVPAGQTVGGVQFTNDCRVHNTQAFYKAPQETENQIVRIFVQREEFADEAVVYFNPNASDNFDDYDSPKFANSAEFPSIYTMSDVEDQLVINGLSTENKQNYVLPLGFKTNNEGEFTISVTEMSNLKAVSTIYLEDTETGSIIELQEGTTYTFWSGIAATESRFKLIMNPAITLIEQLENESNNNEISIYCYSNKVVVSGKDLQGTNIAIFNLGGQCVFSGILNNSTKNILETNLNAGIYTIRTTNNGTVSTKKLFIN